MADCYERFFVKAADLQKLYGSLIDARLKFERLARADPRYANHPRRISQIIDELSRELQDAAAKTAIFADQEIRSRARNRVRPAWAGAGNLADHIQSHPLPAGRLSNAHVEIGELDVLDQVDYWAVQEGVDRHTGQYPGSYYGQVGRVFYGLFQPGDFAPDQGRTISPAGGMEAILTMGGSRARKGTISRPIPAKKFLFEGTDVAWAEYMRLINAAAAKALSAVQAL